MIKITDAELKIMQIIWKKESTTSNEIIEAIKDNEWNDNTTRTLIKRLLNKKAIKIVGKQNKQYTYQPIITEEEYKIEESKDFIQKIYNGSINEMIFNFVKQEKLTKEDLKELLDKIEE